MRPPAIGRELASPDAEATTQDTISGNSIAIWMKKEHVTFDRSVLYQRR
jgi:hypothetical protein